MSLESINTAAAVATFFVILATAIAALMQLRHLHAGNQLNSLLLVAEREQHPEFEQHLHFVRTSLAQRMEEPGYRAGLDVVGLVDRTTHPEMNVIAWFEQIGVLVKNGYLEEKIYLDVSAPRIAFFWDLLEPAIAVRRRKAGATAFENFEYLAVRSKRMMALMQSSYPKRTGHLTLHDPWAAEDDVGARGPAER